MFLLLETKTSPFGFIMDETINGWTDSWMDGWIRHRWWSFVIPRKRRRRRTLSVTELILDNGFCAVIASWVAWET